MPSRRALFHELDPIRWRELDHNPHRPAVARSRWSSSRSGPAGSCCTAGSITPIAACRNTCSPAGTWGAIHAGVLERPAGGLLLGRVRPARIAADLLRRPGRPGRRPHQERVRPGRSPRRRRPVLRPGLFPPAARLDGLAERGIPRRRCQAAAAGAGHRPGQAARDGGHRDAHRHRFTPASGRLAVGRNTLLLLDSERRGQRSRRPRPDGAALRRRLRARAFARSCSLGVGGVRALQRSGHPSRACCTSTRGTAPSPAWR